MSFDLETLKHNFKFLLITITIVVILLALSIIFNTKKNISLEGINLTSGNPTYNKLVINEIMTSNNSTYIDKEGKLYDYVEIYNGTNKDINLKNYGLSDQGNSLKWSFPDVIISAKEYLIVFLSGENRPGLYANFKIKNAGGETLALTKPSGKIVDAITIIPLANNAVMGRNINGDWEVQNDPTPGFANTIEGHDSFINSLVKNDTGELVINEILPNNKGNLKDDFGQYSDYIEVLNIGDKTINLEGYNLSNSGSINYKWQFPNVNLNPQEVILIYASNRDVKEGVLHANFKLTNEVGVVVLSNPRGEIIDKVEYQNVTNGKAYIREKNGYEISSVISPGYINDIDGINTYNTTIKTPKSLIISEVMNSNYKYFSQKGDYYDWIELKNNSPETISLKDYYLTTNSNNLKSYQLPDIELKSGAYYIIIASGNTSLSNRTYQHTHFKLGDSEALYLTKNDQIIDSIFIADVPIGYSIGKGNKTGLYYYSTPTPKKTNGSGIKGIAHEPNIKTKAGVYNDVKSVLVEIKGQGTVYYTLDGSKPTKSSKVYKKPISLTKTTVVRAISVESGKKTSNVITASYIINENHSLPVMSLSLDPGSFRTVNNNIWSHSTEAATSAEYFEEGKEGFAIDCGLQLFGGQSRSYAKQSYEIVFKKKYGAGELHYQVFDNRDYSTYQSLVLRTGSQDEFSKVVSRKIIIKDTLASGIVDKYTDVVTRAYKYVIVYINGDYWGLYAIREKVDENFIKNNYNINSNDTDIVGINGSAKYGYTSKYNKLLAYIRTHSMINNKYYAEVKNQIDINNLIDFWIAEQWIDNVDMFNVQYFSNPNIDNGKWKFIFYDLDRSFFNYRRNTFYFTTSVQGMGNNTGNYYSTELLRALMKNKEFKLTYIQRLSYNLKNVWTEENVLNELNSITSQIETELPRNFRKWGNNMTNWRKQVKYVETFVKNRNKYMVSNAKAYFRLNTNQIKEAFGG